jgi:hypothetical protein
MCCFWKMVSWLAVRQNSSQLYDWAAGEQPGETGAPSHCCTECHVKYLKFQWCSLPQVVQEVKVIELPLWRLPYETTEQNELPPETRFAIACFFSRRGAQGTSALLEISGKLLFSPDITVFCAVSSGRWERPKLAPSSLSGPSGDTPLSKLSEPSTADSGRRESPGTLPASPHSPSSSPPMEPFEMPPVPPLPAEQVELERAIITAHKMVSRVDAKTWHPVDAQRVS